MHRDVHCRVDREACIDGFGTWKFSLKRRVVHPFVSLGLDSARAPPEPGRFRRHRHAEQSPSHSYGTEEPSVMGRHEGYSTHLPSCPSSRRYTSSPSAATTSSCSQKSSALAVQTCLIARPAAPSLPSFFPFLFCFQRSRNC
jgi:hypothetical protein